MILSKEEEVGRNVSRPPDADHAVESISNNTIVESSRLATNNLNRCLLKMGADNVIHNLAVCSEDHDMKPNRSITTEDAFIPIHVFGKLNECDRDCTSRSEIVYIENPAIGHFHRERISDSLLERRHEGKLSIEDSICARREHAVETIRRKIAQALFFAQGTLSGLSTCSIYYLFNDEDDTIYDQSNQQYDGTRTSTRIAYQIGGQVMFVAFSTLCLTGAVLIQYYHKNGNESRSMHSHWARRAMVVVYFISFIFSLFIARMSLLLQHQILQGVSSEELKQSLEAYNLTSMSRSVCSILGWAIVCNRISML